MKLLRGTDKPVLYVANKADSEKQALGTVSYYELDRTLRAFACECARFAAKDGLSEQQKRTLAEAPATGARAA